MKITFLGTGVAIPTAERVQSGLLIDDKFPILFDCGGGILHRIAQAGYNHSDIDTVFFTHHHLDHDSDFIALVKANWLRNKNEINIYSRAAELISIVDGVGPSPLINLNFYEEADLILTTSSQKLWICNLSTGEVIRTVKGAPSYFDFTPTSNLLITATGYDYGIYNIGELSDNDQSKEEVFRSHIRSGAMINHVSISGHGAEVTIGSAEDIFILGYDVINNE